MGRLWHKLSSSQAYTEAWWVVLKAIAQFSQLKNNQLPAPILAGGGKLCWILGLPYFSRFPLQSINRATDCFSIGEYGHQVWVPLFLIASSSGSFLSYSTRIGSVRQFPQTPEGTRGFWVRRPGTHRMSPGLRRRWWTESRRPVLPKVTGEHDVR